MIFVLCLLIFLFLILLQKILPIPILNFFIKKFFTSVIKDKKYNLNLLKFELDILLLK